jgi:hypothetical protein
MALERLQFPQFTIQLWSWIFVATGVLTVIAAHQFGFPTDIGSSIIGAGIGAFTALTKQMQNIDHADVVNQTNDQSTGQKKV